MAASPGKDQRAIAGILLTKGNKMNYVVEQWKYFQDRAKLQVFAVDYAIQNAYFIVAKECLRTPLQAFANSQPADTKITAMPPIGALVPYQDPVGGVGKSQSQHLKGLADDWYIFKDGVDVTGEQTVRPLAEYWKSLDPLNRAGADFVHPRPDPYHFERNV